MRHQRVFVLAGSRLGRRRHDDHQPDASYGKCDLYGENDRASTVNGAAGPITQPQHGCRQSSEHKPDAQRDTAGYACHGVRD